jgi:hypothetical protein
VVQIVYAVTGAVALDIAEQPAVTLHPADAFVFHPRAVTDRLGANVGLRGLAAHAEVVVATLVFGSAIPLWLLRAVSIHAIIRVIYV